MPILQSNVIQPRSNWLVPGATGTNPFDQPWDWDYCYVAGVICPGYCEVTGWDREWGWQEKHARGMQGNILTYTGKPAAKGQIKFYLTEGHDFAEWVTFLPLFKYDPTRINTSAVDVRHPAIQFLEVKACVTLHISQPEHEGLNLWSITVKMAEFTKPPPAPAVSTPAGSNAGAGVNPSATPSPTDPAEIKFNGLWQQFSSP